MGLTTDLRIVQGVGTILDIPDNFSWKLFVKRLDEFELFPRDSHSTQAIKRYKRCYSILDSCSVEDAMRVFKEGDYFEEDDFYIATNGDLQDTLRKAFNKAASKIIGCPIEELRFELTHFEEFDATHHMIIAPFVKLGGCVDRGGCGDDIDGFASYKPQCQTSIDIHVERIHSVMNYLGLRGDTCESRLVVCSFTAYRV